MIKSMTGFGQAAGNRSDYNIVVEIKSLNSKFLDLSLRLPRLLNEKELEIRNLVADKLERGDFDIDQTSVFERFDAPSPPRAHVLKSGRSLTVKPWIPATVYMRDEHGPLDEVPMTGDSWHLQVRHGYAVRSNVVPFHVPEKPVLESGRRCQGSLFW